MKYVVITLIIVLGVIAGLAGYDGLATLYGCVLIAAVIDMKVSK